MNHDKLASIVFGTIIVSAIGVAYLSMQSQKASTTNGQPTTSQTQTTTPAPTPEPATPAPIVPDTTTERSQCFATADQTYQSDVNLMGDVMKKYVAQYGPMTNTQLYVVGNQLIQAKNQKNTDYANCYAKYGN